MPFWLRKLRQALSENFRILKRSNEKEAMRQFEKRLGYKPNIDNPVTYNEKLTRFKLEADKPIFRQLADKLAVRKFVEKRIGKEHLVPLVGHEERLTREFFNSLPESFVIKANHGSAMNHIVLDKKDINFIALRRETDKWLSRNYFVSSREAQYRSIPPCIIVETLLTDSLGKVPSDYRVHCFHAKSEEKHTIIQVDSDSLGNHTRDYFDQNWNQLDIQGKYPNSYTERLPLKPKELEGLIRTAWKLAKGFSYVRVDLYLISGHIYFGEMTFTPVSGFMPLTPSTIDKQWGDWFDLDHQLSLSTLDDL
ncbi:hypothetical protein KZO85_10745 [Chromohalobacter canadensis]|uniref:ATP-grasp fold amidoligase family protein n=1 Tax=Chromohalobacter canadensis TaxID=141389 RepID=UPI0021BF918C|nr:ATP-grasp fold amidoligase family protein [Chromohalobacter canadensis]MCT8469061.1 hypothetical protein [Chromohalobacter canadensis]MCT8472749.1 hypothetical protein [Chromohalobacter canadensis]